MLAYQQLSPSVPSLVIQVKSFRFNYFQAVHTNKSLVLLVNCLTPSAGIHLPQRKGLSDLKQNLSQHERSCPCLSTGALAHPVSRSAAFNSAGSHPHPARSVFIVSSKRSTDTAAG